MDDNTKRLYRSKKNRVFAGIAGGLGQYFNVDPTIIRLVFLLFFFVSGLPIVIMYFVAMLFIPRASGHESAEHSEEKEAEWLEDRRGMIWGVLVVVLILVAIGFLFWGSMFAFHPMTGGWWRY